MISSFIVLAPFFSIIKYSLAFWRLFPQLQHRGTVAKGYSYPFACAPPSRDLRKRIFT
nr:MAG TPA: hypothetical protein [Caudoviricetes sp.]